jgi:hypothetical protein
VENQTMEDNEDFESQAAQLLNYQVCLRKEKKQKKTIYQKF